MSNVITTTDLDISLPSVDVDSALANQIVSAVNAYVESVTRRCWGDKKQVTERHDYGSAIWLYHQDVISVDSVTLGRPGQSIYTVDASSYYFTLLGRVNLYSHAAEVASGSALRAPNDYIAVQYTYGVAEVPDDLRQAAVGIAIGMYNWASDGGREITSTSVGSYSLSFASRRQSAGMGGENGGNAEQSQVAMYQSTIRGYAAPRF